MLLSVMNSVSIAFQISLTCCLNHLFGISKQYVCNLFASIVGEGNLNNRFNVFHTQYFYAISNKFCASFSYYIKYLNTIREKCAKLENCYRLQENLLPEISCPNIYNL